MKKIHHFKNNEIYISNENNIVIDQNEYYKFLIKYNFKILNEPSKEKLLHILDKYLFILDLTSRLNLTISKDDNKYHLKVLIDFNNNVEVFENLIIENLKKLNIITDRIIRKYKILSLNI
jgi:hypothetical protein